MTSIEELVKLVGGSDEDILWLKCGLICDFCEDSVYTTYKDATSVAFLMALFRGERYAVFSFSPNEFHVSKGA